MYTTINFKTKKALKEAVASGKPVGVFQPNEIIASPAASPNFSGSVSVEGPHYEMHRWYATVKVENGKIVKVS